MSDFDRNIAAARTGYRTDQVAIDAGLRAYMIRVYNYMTAGVALTGLVAWFAFQAAGGDQIHIVGNQVTGLTAFGHAIFASPLMWLFVLAPLGLVMLLSFGINRLSASTALTLFFVYAGLLGLSLATIFLAYTGASITRVFFISAATFGAMSLYGYTTKRDLTSVGSFCLMGLIGLIIASVVNMFIQSTAMGFILSCAGVLIFVGLTAYDTQKLKDLGAGSVAGTEADTKLALNGALMLYLDFINLFLQLLRLMGTRRR